jgi:hypothetical protein
MSKAKTSYADDDNSLSVDDDDKENYFSSSGDILVPSRVEVKQKPKSSWVWSHFKQSASGDKAYCFGMLCCQNVKYGCSHSTGMLGCHIKVRHPKTYSNKCAEYAAEILKAEPDISSYITGSTTAALTLKSPISYFLKPCPNFESNLLNWMIKTYQRLVTILVPRLQS